MHFKICDGDNAQPLPHNILPHYTLDCFNNSLFCVLLYKALFLFPFPDFILMPENILFDVPGSFPKKKGLELKIEENIPLLKETKNIFCTLFLI